MQKENGDSAIVPLDLGVAGLSLGYRVNFNGHVSYPLSLKQTGTDREALMEGCRIQDRIRENDAYLSISRTWTVEKAGMWRFDTDILIETPPMEVFIPAVLYRQNDRGTGSFPKGREAETWSYSEERTPLPASVILSRNGCRFGFFKRPAEKAELLASRSLIRDEGRVTLRTSTPGTEFPYSYRGKKKLAPSAEEHGAFLRVSEEMLPYTHREEYYLFVEDEERDIFSFYRRMLEGFPLFREPSPPPRLSWNEYYTLKMKHLLFLAEKDTPSGLHFLTMGRGNGELQKIYNFTAGSFLVKSLEASWIMAEHGSSINDKGILKLAESIGRFFLQGEADKGIHQDCFDLENRHWGGYLGISENDEYRFLINSRCNGETMSGYIRLYRTLAEGGKKIPQFIELPRRVAAFYIRLFHKYGAEMGFGRWWTKEGDPVNSLGTNGAYIVSFLLLLKPYYDDEYSLLDTARKAGDYYCGLVDRGDFYGDTLDADAYDKESGVALMTMFLDLYETDGQKKWLDYAEKCADFLLTWIWQYDIPFPDASLLRKAGFKSRGLTSVSVAHHHMDFYGMSMAYDFLRLWRHKGGNSIKRTPC